MASKVAHLARPTLPTPLALAGTLVAAAVAVGALTTINPFYAIALVVAATVAVIVAADVKALPLFLVFTMFTEGLALGPGLRVGRLAGAMALAVLAYYVIARGWAGLRPNGLVLAAGAFGFWTVASAFWANNTSLVYEVVFSYALAVAYMLSFAVFVRTSAQLKAIFATYAVGSLIFGLVSFVTYLSGDSEQRAAGLQGDPNYFAVYQVLALPAALALAVFERRPQRRLFYYVIVGVIILSVVSSLSRTGLIALTATVAATLLLPWRTFFRRPIQKLTYFFALVLASTAAIAIGSTTFVARAQSILNPESNETSGYRGSGRLDLWDAAINGWHQHPWLGLGAGNFSDQALDLLQTTPGVNTTAGYIYADRVVHNAYLEMLTELGPIGFALFVSVILVTAWYLFSSFRRARDAHEHLLSRFSLALLVMLLGYSLSAIFLSNQLSRALWILVGLALALDVMVRRPRALNELAARAASSGPEPPLPPRPEPPEPAPGPRPEPPEPAPPARGPG